GLALVWVVGVVALLIPGQREFRQNAQRSLVLRRLNEIVSPSTLLHALANVDPFPVIAGPAAPVSPPTLAILRQPQIDAAVPSVVRVLGTACGLGIAGSGWIVAPGVVVTAAHVVAGERDTAADAYGKGAVPRTVTSIGGRVRHGDSGAPAIDSQGRVESTIFAARTGFNSGFGVPSELVRNLLAKARGPVSTGACAP